MSKIRKQLIDKCDVLIDDLQKASIQFNLGKAQQAVTAALTQTSVSVGTAGAAPRKLEITIGQSVPELCQLTHAILVQEWHIFLDSIFQEAVLHYLKKRDTSRFPEQIELELESLDLKDISALRKSIS